MPTYEYECKNGHEFEVEQRITDEPLKRCRLGRARARRLISRSSFILKGSGWYSDGYGSSGDGSTKSSSNGASDSSPSKSTSSSSGEKSTGSSSE